jgi:dipeptidyl-peptidase-4
MQALRTVPTAFLCVPGALALLAGCQTTGTAAAGSKRLALEQTVRGREGSVDFLGRLARVRWADDGRHLIVERGRDEERTRTWFDPVTWTEVDPPADAEEDDAWEPFAAILGIGEERAKEIAAAPATTSEDGTVTLRTHEGVLWFHREGEPARRLRERGEADPELAELSPSGDHAAFVRGNDLFVVDTRTGMEQAVTGDGGVNTFNGKLDWVYQEEIYGRGDFKAFWWSPDSSRVAFLRLDESDVHEFTVIDHIEDGHFRVEPEITKYPKVGDPNPTVRVGVASLDAPASVSWMDLSAYEGDEPLVVRVGWTPDSSRLVFMVQDRIQTWLDLVLADPESGAGRVLLRETSDAWVNRPRPPHWLADGSFLWQSDRTGQRHLYRVALEGETTAVTSGDWGIVRVDEVDEERGLIWFSATRDGAVDANTYRIGLDGTGLVRLTSGEGRHAVSFNADHSLFVDRVSSLTSPTRVTLHDGEGKRLREIDRADLSEVAQYATSAWELHEIQARDGFPLDVALLKPVGFDPKKSYPVWLPTYSGPNAPTVRNAWNGSAWYQFLAQNGVIVLQCNVRSASGKGMETTSQCYRRLGIPELSDLEDAVDWLTKKPWADGERVGITGSSYGGFMAAFALTHSDRFAVGIASSGVYDWRMYDTIYTERYMQTPELNPEGYLATSVIEAAADLDGHLVVTHGIMDDNVHLQNAVQLIYALQQAEQDFELMLYPQNRHGIRDPALRWHDRRLQWRTIREHLLDS